MIDLYKLTVKKHIEEDEHEKTVANRLMRKERNEDIVKNLEGVKEQNTIMKHLKVLYTGKVITQWNEIAEQMTANPLNLPEKPLYSHYLLTQT